MKLCCNVLLDVTGWEKKERVILMRRYNRVSKAVRIVYLAACAVYYRKDILRVMKHL